MAACLPAGDGVQASPHARERRAAWIMAGAIALLTAASTVLHHAFPGVLDVPANRGVPYTSYTAMFLLDLVPVGLAWLCFHHAWRRLGLYRAMIFLAGSFFFTGLEESMWILLGRYHNEIEAALGGPGLEAAAFGERAAEVEGTYYFTRGFFWFIETPVLACLGWFFVAYSCVYAAGLLIPRARGLWRAALGGLLAVNLDLWLDPVQTHESLKSWVWVSQDMINIFSIPLSNFMGWFLLIFLFAMLFEKLPRMTGKLGPYKAAACFYGILIVLELAILLFFAAYGSILMRLIKSPINLTVMGI